MKKSAIYICGILSSGIYCANANAEIKLDGSTGSSGDIIAVDRLYEIDSSLGEKKNNNLYHSFETFNVEPEHIANFSSTDSFKNIISRVTGGKMSRIDGTISSSITGANLYLLNPSGVLFGAGASINISGAFYASTADYLRMGENDYFYTNLSQESTFSTAAPMAFGFTSDQPASINVNGATLENDGNALALIGGDISITDSEDETGVSETKASKLIAKDGLIQVASVASTGEVILSGNDVSLNDFTDLGEISIDSGSNINVSGHSAGRIVVRGGVLTMEQSSMEANSDGSGSNEFTENIDIKTSKSINFEDGSNISNHVGYGSASDTKGIKLSSQQITLNKNSYIESSIASNSTANSGDIELSAERISLDDYSYIETLNKSIGTSGNIVVNSESLSITEGSYIDVLSNSSGTIGNIYINSDSILIKGPETSNDPFGADYTGLVSFKDSRLSQGGDIIINKNDELVLDSRSAIATNNLGTEDAGDIDIDSNSIKMLRGAIISTESSENGNGGDITINSEDLIIKGVHEEHDGTTFYESKISASGPSDKDSTGNTGDINIYADKLNILDGAFIITSSRNNVGKYGNIDINSNDIRVSGVNKYKKQAYLDFGDTLEDSIRVSSSHILMFASNEDNGDNLPNPKLGTLSINSDSIFLGSGGYLSTEAWGTADSSDISITAELLDLASGSYISSSATTGTGDAGDVIIQAMDISIDGTGSQVKKTGIYSNNSENGGTGGDIQITLETLNMESGSTISSETVGDNNGGNVEIFSNDKVVLKHQSSITSKASNEANGDAGNININTELFVLSNSDITTSAVSGHGGDITIKANNIIVSGDSLIDAASEESVSGVVNIINSRDITSSLIQLPQNINTTNIQFSDDCVENTGETSSLVTRNKKHLTTNRKFFPSNYKDFIDTGDYAFDKHTNHYIANNQIRDTFKKTIKSSGTCDRI